MYQWKTADQFIFTYENEINAALLVIMALVLGYGLLRMLNIVEAYKTWSWKKLNPIWLMGSIINDWKQDKCHNFIFDCFTILVGVFLFSGMLVWFCGSLWVASKLI